MRLILACGSANPVEQIVWMDKRQFERHLQDEEERQTIKQKELLSFLEQELGLAPMANPFEYVKALQAGFDDSKIRKSLETAIDELQMPKSQSFHAALSDAYYTAESLKILPYEQIFEFYSIDYFRSPANRKEEIYVIFDGYSKFVSREFSSKKELMKDRKVTSTRCYLCGKNAKKKIRWFASGGKNFSCLAYCEEHGYLKGKIRLKKCENSDHFFCVKTIKQVDVDRAGDLLERKLTLQERRRLKRHHE